MGSSNFVQHNPTEANQQTDAEFDSNSLTTGGIGQDAIMPGKWMNKRWYQDSTFIAAFAQALANKGYVLSDANVATLTGVLGNVLTNADVKQSLVFVNYTPTPTFDASLANGFRFTMAGNVTASALVNITFGQILTFVIQNAGNFTFVWPPNVLGPLPIIGPNITPSNVETQQFVVLEDGNAYPMNPLLLALINTKQDALGFVPVEQGGGANQLANKIRIGWSGSRLKGQVDGADLGNFVFDAQLAAALAGVVTRGAAVGNGNGTFFRWSDGLLEQWGLSSTGSAVGVNRTSFFVTFPTPFTQIPTVVISANVNPDSYGTAVLGCYPTNISQFGFTANVAAGVTIGGSGPANINNSIRVNFMAKGF